MISPEQCRGARALLAWSQEDLEKQSSVAKKTIADFERGARIPHPGNLNALEAALAGAGVVFIPQNGGGEGVRLGRPRPLFIRRSDLPGRHLIFAFSYRGEKRPGIVHYDALNQYGHLEPVAAFDKLKIPILLCAADKVDRGELPIEIREGDLVIRP